MPNLGSLTYDLVANTQKFSSGLTKAERIAKRRSRNIKAAFTGIGLAVAGIGITISRMVRSVQETADSYDKLSIRLGISVQALSELQFAADIAGVSFEKLTMATQRSTRRIAEAAMGTGEAVKALKELNLSASELNKLAPDQQLEVLADAFLEVENSADKVRLAMKLFDSEGVAMIQLLEKGGEGLRDMRDRAEELGLTMDRGTVAAMVELKDTMTEVNAISEGATRILAASLAPSLKIVAEWFAIAATWAAKFLDSLRDIDKQTNLQSLQDQLLAVQIRINNMQAELDKKGGKSRGQLGNRLQENIDLAGQLINRLKDLQSESKANAKLLLPTVTGPGAAGAAKTAASGREAFESFRTSLLDEETALQESFFRRQEQLETWLETGAITKQQFMEGEMLAHLDFNERMDQINQDRINNELRVEQEIADGKQKIRQKFTNNAIGLLQLLGQKNKAFGVAAIVLQKAMALQEIAINFAKHQRMLGILEAVAVAQAMAQLGPIAGPPAAAKIHAQFAGLRALATTSAVLGGILEVATGIQQIGNLQGGAEGGLGGGTTGVSAVDPITGFPVSGGSTRGTNVTINIGDNKVFSDEAIRTLIEKINDQIDDGVVIKGIVVA